MNYDNINPTEVSLLDLTKILRFLRMQSSYATQMQIMTALEEGLGEEVVFLAKAILDKNGISHG